MRSARTLGVAAQVLGECCERCSTAVGSARTCSVAAQVFGECGERGSSVRVRRGAQAQVRQVGPQTARARAGLAPVPPRRDLHRQHGAVRRALAPRAPRHSRQLACIWGTSFSTSDAYFL